MEVLNLKYQNQIQEYLGRVLADIEVCDTNIRECIGMLKDSFLMLKETTGTFHYREKYF